MSCAPVSKRISTRASDSCGSACRIVTVSSTSECETVRDFAPYQRCRVTYSMSDCSSIQSTRSSCLSWNQKNPRGASVRR